MEPESPKPRSAVAEAQPRSWAHAAHKPVFILFLAFLAFEWMRLFLGMREARVGGDGGIWLLASATALVGLARRLPGQNVAISAFLITGISFVVGVVGARTSIPFGPRVYTDQLGTPVMGVPWSLPLLWMVSIVSSRGVARLIMRPWRKTTYYGFWVIGLTALLALWLDVSLEPFATRVGHYWLWQTSPGVPHWYSAPWANFLGWLVTGLGILGFTTPWLINKQPVKQPTDYHPLALWLLVNLFFLSGSAMNGMWLAAGVSLVGCAIAAAYAVRGARW